MLQLAYRTSLCGRARQAPGVTLWGAVRDTRGLIRMHSLRRRKKLTLGRLLPSIPAADFLAKTALLCTKHRKSLVRTT